MESIGERIKQRRIALGISAEELSDILNVSPSTMYRYENGDIEKVPGKIMEPLSKALHTTPAYLMGWEENLETNVSFIPQLMKDEKTIEHIKLLLKLSDSNKKSIFDMIDFLAQKEGL